MSQQRLLLIDHDSKSTDFMRQSLEDAGYSVEIAVDGPTGLVAYKRSKPDLVIVEAMLPQQHGFAICQEIKQSDEGEYTPVIVTSSSYTGRSARTDALSIYKCDEYLEKPVPGERLVKICRELLSPDRDAKADSQQAVATPATRAPRLDDLSEQQLIDQLEQMLPAESKEPAAQALATPRKQPGSIPSGPRVVTAIPDLNTTADEALLAVTQDLIENDVESANLRDTLESDVEALEAEFRSLQTDPAVPDREEAAAPSPKATVVGHSASIDSTRPVQLTEEEIVDRLDRVLSDSVVDEEEEDGDDEFIDEPLGAPLVAAAEPPPVAQVHRVVAPTPEAQRDVSDKLESLPEPEDRPRFHFVAEFAHEAAPQNRPVAEGVIPEAAAELQPVAELEPDTAPEPDAELAPEPAPELHAELAPEPAPELHAELAPEPDDESEPAALQLHPVTDEPHQPPPAPTAAPSDIPARPVVAPPAPARPLRTPALTPNAKPGVGLRATPQARTAIEQTARIPAVSTFKPEAPKRRGRRGLVAGVTILVVVAAAAAGGFFLLREQSPAAPTPVNVAAPVSNERALRTQPFATRKSPPAGTSADASSDPLSLPEETTPSDGDTTAVVSKPAATPPVGRHVAPNEDPAPSTRDARPESANRQASTTPPPVETATLTQKPTPTPPQTQTPTQNPVSPEAPGVLALSDVGRLQVASGGSIEALSVRPQPAKPAEIPEPAPPATARGSLVELAEVDVKPVALQQASPVYPAASRRLQQQGTVYLNLLIDENGQVRQARVTGGDAGGRLESAAREAALTWFYSPAMKDGVPVRVWMATEILFQR